MGLVVAGSPWGQPGGAKEPDLRKIPGVQGDGRQELEALHLPGAQESGPFQPPPMLALTWEGVSGPVGATVRSCWEKFVICLGQPKGRVGLYLFELILSHCSE